MLSTIGADPQKAKGQENARAAHGVLAQTELARSRNTHTHARKARDAVINEVKFYRKADFCVSVSDSLTFELIQEFFTLPTFVVFNTFCSFGSAGR